jgi:hypothetical protein
MENFHWKEYWSLLQESLQKTYRNLTTDDLQYTEGEEDELMNRLQQKLRKSRAEVNEILFIHLIGVDDDLIGVDDADEEAEEIPDIIDQIEKDLANKRYYPDWNNAWSWS